MFIKQYLLFQLQRISEKMIFWRSLRKVSYFFYRWKKPTEFDLVKKKVEQYPEKKIIALCVPSAYVFEHIRDVWEYYQTDINFCPLIIGPNVDPNHSAKVKHKLFFEKTYGMTYFRDIIPHPWIKFIQPSVILETALNTYAGDSDAPRIMYTHGMGGINFSKDLRHVKYLNHHTALFLNSPFQKKALLIAAKQYHVKLPEMYEIGYLRGDRLLRSAKTFNRPIYLQKYNLEDLPVVVFAPTWGFFSALNEWYDSVIEVAASLDINLLLRLHPLTTGGKHGARWQQRIEKTLVKNKRVRVEHSHNIDDLLLAADLLITDISGLSMEFMTLNKPVTFLPAPLYFKLYGNERPEQWVLPKEMIKTKLDLKKSIESNLKDKQPTVEVNELMYNRGNALNSMIYAIEDVIEKNRR